MTDPAYIVSFFKFPATRLFPLTLLTATALHAGFDITVEPGAGFQTNVPDGRTDSSFSDYLFCALDAEPVWTTDTSAKIRCVISAPLNATKYIGGPGEIDIAPELSIEKSAVLHTTSATLGAAYHFMPAAYDPTIPENFLEFSLGCERENTGKHPLDGMYAFSLMKDLTTPRIDFKNVLQLTLHRNGSARVSAFIKTGCSWTVSNSEGAGYVQPRVAGGMSIPFNERNLLLLQLFAAYSFYNPMNVPVLTTVGRGRRQKKTDTLVTHVLSVPRIPFASFYGGYDRELTQHLSLHLYYTATLFGRGRRDSLLLSHQSGIIFSWYRE